MELYRKIGESDEAYASRLHDELIKDNLTSDEAYSIVNAQLAREKRIKEAREKIKNIDTEKIILK